MDIVLKYLVRVGDKLHCVCALYLCGWSSCTVAIGVWVEQCGGSWSEKAGEVQGRFSQIGRTPPGLWSSRSNAVP